MFIDALGQVSAAQQVTADAVSTNTIDLGNVTPKRAIGTGEPVGFAISISAIGTTTGSIIISAIESAGADLSSPVKLNARALVTADIAAGKSYFIALPPGTPRLRYVGLDYDVTGTVDATISATLITQAGFAAQTTYAKGYTIS